MDIHAASGHKTWGEVLITFLWICIYPKNIFYLHLERTSVSLCLPDGHQEDHLQISRNSYTSSLCSLYICIIFSECYACELDLKISWQLSCLPSCTNVSFRLASLNSCLALFFSSLTFLKALSWFIDASFFLFDTKELFLTPFSLVYPFYKHWVLCFHSIYDRTLGTSCLNKRGSLQLTNLQQMLVTSGLI